MRTHTPYVFHASDSDAQRCFIWPKWDSDVLSGSDKQPAASQPLHQAAFHWISGKACRSDLLLQIKARFFYWKISSPGSKWDSSVLPWDPQFILLTCVLVGPARSRPAKYFRFVGPVQGTWEGNKVSPTTDSHHINSAFCTPTLILVILTHPALFSLEGCQRNLHREKKGSALISV